MKVYSGRRASAVLFNWLLSNKIKGKVLLPANICESVPAVYMKAGLSVDFCDIKYGTWMPDERQILNMLNSEHISILHYNHTYGASGDEALIQIRSMFPDLIIVEDCCLGIPEIENFNGIADLKLFSTGHTKIVNIGYGGFATVSDRYNYSMHKSPNYKVENVKAFDNHVKQCHRIFQPVKRSVMLGEWMNTEDDVEDNYFKSVKKELENIIPYKQQINKIYRSWCLNMPENMQMWRYNVLVENQKECLDILYENDLYASNHYMSLGNGYFSDRRTPNTNWLESHIINLFNDKNYSIYQAEKTVDLLSKIARTM